MIWRNRRGQTGTSGRPGLRHHPPTVSATLPKEPKAACGQGWSPHEQTRVLRNWRLAVGARSWGSVRIEQSLSGFPRSHQAHGSLTARAKRRAAPPSRRGRWRGRWRGWWRGWWRGRWCGWWCGWWYFTLSTAVGTPRCGVPAPFRRGTFAPRHGHRARDNAHGSAAARGGDGAARRPYLSLRA